MSARHLTEDSHYETLEGTHTIPLSEFDLPATGRHVNGDFACYHITARADVPDIETDFVPDYEPGDPSGIKGGPRAARGAALRRRPPPGGPTPRVGPPGAPQRPRTTTARGHDAVAEHGTWCGSPQGGRAEGIVSDDVTVSPGRTHK